MKLPKLSRLAGWGWARSRQPDSAASATVEQQGAVIASFLQSPKPCALGKIGTSELRVLEYGERWLQLPWPKAASWRRPAERLYNTGGLFPVRRDIFYRFLESYRSVLSRMDLVALWQTFGTYESALEHAAVERWAPQARKTGFYFIRFVKPYGTWLEDLARLRWLVVHPFKTSILHQLPRIHDFGIFSEISRPDLADRIRDTRILPCPQLAYMTAPLHRDWFETLHFLEARMEEEAENFDVALVGAGAWSLPLVAHAKKMGKKGIHLGGALQLLFGIKGGRFDPACIYNSAWIRPLPEDRPVNHRLMENGAYW